jgi:uncharacterized protein with PQ loop repeat
MRYAVGDAAVACGYVGALLCVCMVVPQIAGTFRDRSLPGVSALSWALTGLSSGAWLLYGLRAHEGPQIPGNALVVTGAVVIVLAAPSPIAQRGRAGILATAVLVLIGSGVLLSAVDVGLVAFGIGIVSTLPQVAKSLVGLPVAGASAVAVPSWLLRAVAQLCWMFFAIVERDGVVLASSSLILCSSLLVSAAELRRRRLSRASAKRSSPGDPPLDEGRRRCGDLVDVRRTPERNRVPL